MADGAEGEQQKYGINMAQCAALHLRVQCILQQCISRAAAHELSAVFSFFGFKIAVESLE